MVITPAATSGHDMNPGDQRPLSTSSDVPDMTATSASQVSSQSSINDQKSDSGNSGKSASSTISDKAGSLNPPEEHKNQDDKDDFLQIPTNRNRIT